MRPSFWLSRNVSSRIASTRTDAASVAAPVLDRSGRARAAISLVGPRAEIARDLGRPGRLVTVAARRIARSLGV